MVDPQQPLPIGDDVTEFTVGVIGHKIQHGDWPQVVATDLDQCHRVKLRVEFDKPLDGTGTVRPIAEHRLGDDVVAERLRDLVRQGLPSRQRFDGEIMQRALACSWLVDNLLTGGGLRQQRRVRRIDKSADNLGDRRFPTHR